MVQWLKGAQREPWLQAGLVSPPTGIPSPWSVSGTEEPFDGEGDVPPPPHCTDEETEAE